MFRFTYSCTALVVLSLFLVIVIYMTFENRWIFIKRDNVINGQQNVEQKVGSRESEDQVKGDASTIKPNEGQSMGNSESKVQVKEDVFTAKLNIGSRESKVQFKFINKLVTEFDEEVAARVRSLVERKAPSRDSELIRLAQSLLDPPPTHGSLTLSKGLLQTPQSNEVDELLKHKKKGFFVECGALDGERASNSLPLEMERQWTGVLIEANPYYYTQLLGKNRNVWSINACLSPYDYATQLQFESSKGHTGRVVMGGKSEIKKNNFVACFPLETILLALNQTRVDYFSLDVEGLELEVLKTIPFDRIDINVLSVEYLHGGKEEYKKFMERKGFKTHKEIKFNEPRAGLFAEDYIFVKIDQ